MGGKTQQRVAGNVKPTNSGRIRELLANQQGAANVITFSALAQAGKSPFQPNPTQNVQKQPSPKIRPNRRRCIEMPKDLTNLPPTLENSTNPSEHQQTQPACEQSQPSALPTTSTPESSPTVQPDEVLDFESLIDQLAAIQIQCDENKCESLEEYDDATVDRETELMKVLEKLVVNFKTEISIEDWDLIVTSIYKWEALISASDDPTSTPRRAQFSADVFNFIFQLILTVKNQNELETISKENSLIRSILDDWNNFHSSSLFENIVVLFLKLVSKGISDINTPLVEALASIIVEVDAKSVISEKNLVENFANSILELDSECHFPKNSVFCELDQKELRGFPALCPLLARHVRVVSVTSHAILSANMQEVCKHIDLDVSQLENDTGELLILPPFALMSVLISEDSIMTALLSDFQVGDISVTMDPNSDSYTCTLSYLLIWDLIISFIVKVDKEIGQRMIHSLKTMNLIGRLLDNIFILLPPLGARNSLQLKMEENLNQTNTSPTSWSLSSYLKSPLKVSIRRAINEIELIALHVYFSIAAHMPVTVRKWYNNNSNKKLCNIVNEYTVKHISQIICSLEMENVLEKCKERALEDKVINLTIKARPSAKEVYAIYTRDEFRMELTIRLPLNYPLGSVQIDGGKRVGVTDLKWRSWLLQLTTFLSHQNGPILDGIDLWRRNIDKKFEGVEKCMICFSILHSNYQLPKKKCATCSKMFHNLCLYKWFKTSGNSKCPLCRNIW